MAQEPIVPPADDAPANLFPNGGEWVRADFHLHTKADKEFHYEGDENAFTAAYADRSSRRAFA